MTTVVLLTMHHFFSEEDAAEPGVTASPQSLSDRHVALWSLKLREVHRIPGTACEEIRQNVGDIL